MNWPFLRHRQHKWSERFHNQGWQQFLGGGLAALVIVGLQGLGLFAPLEKLAYFSLFRLRGVQDWDRRLAIVAIDEAAIAELERLSWSREPYAKLLDALSPAAPRLVIFDVLMTRPTPQDRQLAAAMKRGAPVILAMAWDRQGEVRQAPLELRDLAIAQGHIIKEEDDNGIIRKIEPEIRETPALSLAATRAYGDRAEAQLKEASPLWVNWPGAVEQVPTYAFNDVIEGKVNPAVFRDKIVLVGTTAAGFDPLETPFNRKTTASGIHLHAAAIDNLLQNNALRSLSPRPRSLFSLLIYLGGGPVLGLGLASLRWRQKLLVGFSLSVGWGIFGLASFGANYLLPLVSPITLMSLTGVTVALQDRLKANAQLKEREEQLQRQAFYDALTGLPNRALFVEHLNHTTAKASRDGREAFAVLFLDLDRFKLINARWGRQIGDRLLAEIAQRLLKLRTQTSYPLTLARFSGDEFVLLLRQIDSLKSAIEVACKIEDLLRQPFELDGQKLFSSVSIGIVCSLEPSSCEPLEQQTSALFDQPESILRNAEIAMYQAKGQGKACYALFNSDLRQNAIAFLQLESDLRQAVSKPSLSGIGADSANLEVTRGQERMQSYMEAQDAIIEREFHLHYQPIVSIATGRIVGFEALIRWHHPQRGWISPTEFIPLAEETGSIGILGEWVLCKACQQLSHWQGMFPQHELLTMAVNLSPFQLKQLELPQKITSILKETGLKSHCLKLEITESGLMANAEVAVSLLNKLATLGVQLCIDDFGIGYSSLGRLQHLPFDTLKIDRSFVQHIVVDDESWEIVQTILSLAHALGMSAIAEGVETAEHLQQLRKLQCDCGQGYHFSRPLDAKGAEALLAANLRW